MEGNSYINVLVVFYLQLPMGRKDTVFGVKYQNILVGWHLLNYKEMFVGTPVYIRYFVIVIVVFTSMLAIGLFHLTPICLFLGCFFESLPLFIHYMSVVYP